MPQVMFVFVRRPGLSTFQDLNLYSCPSDGIFEATTTPLTEANRFSNSRVMTKDFGVCCILRDMAGNVGLRWHKKDRAVCVAGL